MAAKHRRKLGGNAVRPPGRVAPGKAAAWRVGLMCCSELPPDWSGAASARLLASVTDGVQLCVIVSGLSNPLEPRDSVHITLAFLSCLSFCCYGASFSSPDD